MAMTSDLPALKILVGRAEGTVCSPEVVKLENLISISGSMELMEIHCVGKTVQVHKRIYPSIPGIINRYFAELMCVCTVK